MSETCSGLNKETFCKAIRMIREQERTDEAFNKALQTVGDGHFVFGAGNGYLRALLMVLKEVVHDRYDYIEWWLYEDGDHHIWSADETQEWNLESPEALYDYITTECHSTEGKRVT